MPLPVRANDSDGGVVVHDTARALRVAGQTVLPGEGRTLPFTFAGRTDAADAMPVWVAAGARPGPRVTIVAAPRGFEAGASRVAARLRTVVDPAALQGGMVVVPVFRPGGRFAARGQPVPSSAEWKFPGDPGGNRHAREAFAVFSDLVVGSAVLVLLTAPAPGLNAVFTVCGDFDDPRVRRLASYLPGATAVNRKPILGSLAAAAKEMGTAVVELCCSGEPTSDSVALSAVVALLAAAGTAAEGAVSAVPPRPTPVIPQATLVRAPAGGLVEEVMAPGTLVERGALMARVVPPLFGRVVDVLAPHDGLILEATARSGVRARASLFLLGRVSRASIARGQKSRRLSVAQGDAAPSASLPTISGSRTDAHPLHVGWVERVSLPSLGVERLRAKIDTGARTSALHVTRMVGVGTTDGPHKRPILELTLPAGSRRGAPPATVRVLVRDYVQVKDTSGRTERRPVIETTLRLGTLERRIRVTLTNRGDMLFPLLIGRTALGPGVVVDPARRLLLNEAPAPAPSRVTPPSPAAAKVPRSGPGGRKVASSARRSPAQANPVVHRGEPAG